MSEMMRKGMRKWTVQEKEIHELRESLSDVRKMIVERAHNKGLSLEDCSEVVAFINKSLEGSD